MAKGANAAAAGSAPPRGMQTLTWMQGLACGAMITFEPATVAVLAVLLAPALVSMIAEHGPSKGVTRSVLLACVAAALSPVWQVWLQGNRLEDALSHLSQPFVLLLAWGAGATAWALCQVLPVVLRGIGDLREAARTKSLEAQLRQLRADWELKETKS